MDKQIITLSASNVSISENSSGSNKHYMSLKMRMMSTRVNLNNMRVTEQFIDDIVANSNEYVGMPLCVDLAKLKGSDYKG